MVIIPPPSLKDAMKYNHKRLIRVLRHCPLSETFAYDQTRLNCHVIMKKKALNEVMKLIWKAQGLLKMPDIAEQNSAEEMSLRALSQSEERPIPQDAFCAAKPSSEIEEEDEEEKEQKRVLRPNTRKQLLKQKTVDV